MNKVQEEKLPDSCKAQKLKYIQGLKAENMKEGRGS